MKNVSNVSKDDEVKTTKTIITHIKVTSKPTINHIFAKLNTEILIISYEL